MNPRHLMRLILVTAILIVCFLLWQKQREPQPPESKAPRAHQIPPIGPQARVRGDEKIQSPPLMKGHRPVYGTLPAGITHIGQLPMANRPHPEWRKSLEKHLRRLGGKSLKQLMIEPQESYVILDGRAGRYVERVVVKISGKKGEYTSFFAEVDGQTGLVLKSWGAAIPEKRPHLHHQ